MTVKGLNELQIGNIVMILRPGDHLGFIGIIEQLQINGANAKIKLWSNYYILENYAQLEICNEAMFNT